MNFPDMQNSFPINSRVKVQGIRRLGTVIEHRQKPGGTGQLRLRWDGKRQGNRGKQVSVDPDNCRPTTAAPWFVDERRYAKRDAIRARYAKRLVAIKSGTIKAKWHCAHCGQPEPIPNFEFHGEYLCRPCNNKRLERDRDNARIPAIHSPVPHQPVYIPPSPLAREIPSAGTSWAPSGNVPTPSPVQPVVRKWTQPVKTDAPANP